MEQQGSHRLATTGGFRPCRQRINHIQHALIGVFFARVFRRTATASTTGRAGLVIAVIRSGTTATHRTIAILIGVVDRSTAARWTRRIIIFEIVNHRATATHRTIAILIKIIGCGAATARWTLIVFLEIIRHRTATAHRARLIIVISHSTTPSRTVLIIGIIGRAAATGAARRVLFIIGGVIVGSFGGSGRIGIRQSGCLKQRGGVFLDLQLKGCAGSTGATHYTTATATAASRLRCFGVRLGSSRSL